MIRTASRKHAIAAAFGRASATYDRHAQVQALAAAALAEGIAALRLPASPALLEIGCGTGLLTEALHRLLPDARALITDLAPPMVRACRARLGAAPWRYAVMDGEAPAVADQAFDLICGSLVVQWFEHPARALPRLHGKLRPGGVLAIATLGPGTLSGWARACRAEGLAPPLAAFPAPGALAAAWPGDTRFRRETLRTAHGGARDFLAALRGIGAQTPRAAHPRFSAGELRRALARFESDHGAVAEYDVIHAFLSA